LPEYWLTIKLKFYKHGSRSKQDVITAKIKIERDQTYSSIVPVLIPDLAEVRRFAHLLHGAGQFWEGEFMGWTAEYNPQKNERPLDSQMTFTPADFCIGESGIWFFSLMWENGHDQPPVEFLDNKSVAVI
jgi:hypothetical protein